MLDGWINDGSTVQACYLTRCSAGVLEIGVTSEDASITWTGCPTAGAAVTPTGSGIDSGSITCPDIPELLCDPHACPGLACDGTEQCVAGVCLCGAAFGVDCVAPPPAPPAPPPSPATPPQPPASPGASYKPVLLFSLTVVGTVDAFDSAAFKTSLAAFLGNDITAADITLEISSGSVVVHVSAVAPTASAAIAAANTISSATTVSLSASLGVTVTSVTNPTVSVQLVAAPPPTPQPAPPPPVESLSLILIAVAAGAVAVLILAGIYWRLRQKRITTWPTRGKESAATQSL